MKINKIPEFYMILPGIYFFPNYGGQLPPAYPDSYTYETQLRLTPHFERFAPRDLRSSHGSVVK